MTTANTAQRNAMNDAGNALFEAGTGNSELRIQNTLNENLVVVLCNDTDAVGDSVAGVATLNIPSVAEYGADVTWFGGSNPVSVVSEATPTDRVATHGWLTDKDGNEVEQLTLTEIGLSQSNIQSAVNVTFSAAPTITQRATAV